METAELISRIIGREDKEVVSTRSGSSSGGIGQKNRSHNQSVSLQERSLVRIQDAVGLEQGEFIGQTVETESTFSKASLTAAMHKRKGTSWSRSPTLVTMGNCALKKHIE